MESRLDARRKDFKKPVEDPRRKREDQQVQIRAAMREAHINKRRQQATVGLDSVAKDGSAMATDAPEFTLEQLTTLSARLMTDNPEAQLDAATQIRKLLSIEHAPPLQEIINCGVVPRLVEFLGCYNKPALQFEAAWALTNIASGTPEQTTTVVEAGGIPKFIELLDSPKAPVKEQAVWALGNIAGDSSKLRNMVLEAGGLKKLITLAQAFACEPITNISILRNATWAMANMCRGKPEPPYEVIEPVVPVLRMMLYLQDDEVLSDAAWALSYFSDGPDVKCIEAIISHGCCFRLGQLLSHPSPKIQTPALRAIGNIVTGNEQQTQSVILCGALPALKTILETSKKVAKKETCWTLSNITAGSKEQIQAVIDAGLIPVLINTLYTAEFDVKKEAAWAVANVAIGGSADQIEYLMSAGAVKPLCDLLEVEDKKIVVVSLEALENVLKTGKVAQAMKNLPENPAVSLLEQADGFPKLEKMQYENKSSEIYKSAIRIMTEYLDLECADVDVAAEQLQQQQQQPIEQVQYNL